jgi:hypothetical protein
VTARTAASSANIESSAASSFARPRSSTSSAPAQILGRRNRETSNEFGERATPTTAGPHRDIASGGEATGSPPPQKRRKAIGEIMLGDGDATSPSDGGDAVGRSNGSFAAGSQRSTVAGVTNGTHKSTLGVNGSNGVKAARASVQRPSTYFGHDTSEVTRLLIQTLSDLGYDEAAELVGSESGYKLESPTVAAFRSAVLGGSWAEAERLLYGAADAESGAPEQDTLILAPCADRNLMRCWLRTQKFLELLEQRDTARALSVLREELTPIYSDTSKLHFLSSLLMCQSFADIEAKTKWDGANGDSRRALLSRLSSMYSNPPPVLWSASQGKAHEKEKKFTPLLTCFRMYLTFSYVTRKPPRSPAPASQAIPD